MNELLLTPFIPFDIKCKNLNLMQKTSGNAFLRDLGERVFHRFALYHEDCPQYLSEFLWII